MVNVIGKMQQVAIWANFVQKRCMTQLNDKSSLLAFLRSRKSASAKAMTEPGPDQSQLSVILDMAVRVPDHGKLAPWRFIVFQGEAREKIGNAFAAAWGNVHPQHGADSLDFQRKLFARAPVVVAVVSTAKAHAKIPVWEQQMSAGAVCFNLELSAQALGFDVQWQTDWVAYDAHAKSAMGVHTDETIAGLIYIGTTSAALEDRPRPDAGALTTYWS
jgi:nitroreductase